MEQLELGLDPESLRKLTKIIKCISCNNKNFGIKANSGENGNILDGKLICKKCRNFYEIKHGILIAIRKKLGSWVKLEKNSSENYSNVENNTYMTSRSMRHLYKYQFSHIDDFRKKGSIVEIGCGNGWFLNHLLRKHNFDLVVGVDLSFNALLNAKKRTPANVMLVQADSNNLPFIDNVFDNCLTQGVLHHIKSAKDTLKEMNRIVKKGGVITVQDKNADNFLIPFINEVIMHALLHRIGEATFVKKAINHRTVKKILNNNGFKTYSFKFHDVVAWPSLIIIEKIKAQFLVSLIVYLDTILSKIPVFSNIFSWRYTIIAEKSGIGGDKAL